MKKLFPFLAFAFLLACGDTHEKSETMKEAEKVHASIIDLSGDVASIIQHKVDALKVKLEAAVAEGDTSLAMQLDALNSQLDSLHHRFEEWEGNMVEIPGHTHSHDHGEHGHDCEHDHAQDAIMDGLSDDEHLEIQKEQLDQLEKLKSEVETVEI